MVLNFKEKFCVKFLMEPCAENILSSNVNSHCMLKKRKKKSRLLGNNKEHRLMCVCFVRAQCITGFCKVHHSNVRLQRENTKLQLSQMNRELFNIKTCSFSINVVMDERCKKECCFAALLP